MAMPADVLQRRSRRVPGLRRPGRLCSAAGFPSGQRSATGACGPAAGPLVLAHLNHMLRGADSDSDADFVAGLHAGLRAAGTK